MAGAAGAEEFWRRLTRQSAASGRAYTDAAISSLAAQSHKPLSPENNDFVMPAQAEIQRQLVCAKKYRC